MKKLLSSVYKSAIILTIVAQSPCAMEPSKENKTKTSPFSPQKRNEKVNAPWKITNNSHLKLKPLDVLSSPIVQDGRNKIEDKCISNTTPQLWTLKRKNEQSDPIIEFKKQKTDIYDFEEINETNIDSFIALAPVSDNTKNIFNPISPQKSTTKVNSGFNAPMHPKLIEFYGITPLVVESKKQRTDIHDFEEINETNIDSFIALAPVSDNTKNISNVFSPQKCSVKVNSGFSKPMHPKPGQLCIPSPLITQGSLKISDVNKSPSPKISSPLPPLKTLKENVVTPRLIHNHTQKTSYTNHREDKDLCEVTHIQGRDEHLMILRDMLESAEEKILITSQSISRIDHDIYKLLFDAVDRGVKIHIYYNNFINEKVEEKFQDYNISCKQKNIHAKYLIVDDRKHFIVGSYNWLDFKYGEADRSFKISGNGSYVNQLRGKAWSDIIENRYSPSNEKYAFKELDINRSSNLMFITTLFDHEGYLLYACKEARKRVVIYSPFVTLDNAKKRLNDISENLNKNTKLFLYVGQRYNELNYFIKNHSSLKKITEITFDDQFHRKTLIIDDNIISEGSFNWLSSATNTESDYHNQDSSLVIRGPLARDIINSDDDLYDSVG